MTIQIRKAQKEDVQTILSLGKKTFLDTYYHLNEPESIDKYVAEHFNLPRVKKEWNDPTNHFFMAYLGKEVVGYFKLRANTPKELTAYKVLEIERIYVDQAYQGKKIGKAMMQQAIATAKSLDCDYIWLGVWEHNANALAFYKKQGFEIWGKHVFMMGDEKQEDYLMRKKLS